MTPSRASQALVVVLVLALELVARVLRAPLYPAVALLAVSAAPSTRALLCVAFVGVEVALLGLRAWPLIVAVTLASLLAARAPPGPRSFALRVALTALLWNGLTRLAVEPSSVGIDALLAALLVRVTASEALAMAATHALLALWIVLSAALIARLTRSTVNAVLARARSGARAGALTALLLASACAAPVLGSLEPAPVPGDGEVVVAPTPAARAVHPVLPRAARTDEVCRACHEATVAHTERDRTSKGFHEVHAWHAPGFSLACVDCHVDAGDPAFPGPQPGLHQRRVANRGCVQCHRDPNVDTGAPWWPRRTR